VWQPKPVDVTASEAMMAASANKAPAARDEAKKFLEDLLRSGPVLKTEIEDAAEGNGISMRTVERAKAELGVIAGKKAFAGKWSWELPPRPKVWTDND
jgi:putative DNA primase/helicase